ncbi:MAG: hypothetical protein Q4G43_04185 [Mobilicoccus sp.]|nr:hypothetical protein [Mobilicoccus sp.]
MGGTQGLEVSPGIGAFLAFFLVAVALWLLMRSMYGRMRNVRFDEAAADAAREREAGDQVVSRPYRRQLFLPVRDEPARGASAEQKARDDVSAQPVDAPEAAREEQDRSEGRSA